MAAMKLGEMLIQAGLLTPEQLEQVLNAQSIYGGRLGTNLVEMGLVDEEELARVLHEKLGVPAVAPSALERIPQDVLAVVPLEMVEAYRALPLALEGKKLTLAMVDPSDFKAIEEIGFVTGLVVHPRVCAELRLNIALERYYGIKRSIRYIPVAGGSRTEVDGALAHSLAEATGHAVALPQGQAERRAAIQVRLTREALAERLVGARREIQVVAALMSYLSGAFDRAAFLRLKGDTAIGVTAVAGGDEVERFNGFSLALDDAPQLKRVAREGRPFVGEVGGGAAGTLMRAMGGEASGPAMVVPVALGGKVAGVICVNDRKGKLAVEADDLKRVGSMAELAFEMLVLKKRILAR